MPTEPTFEQRQRLAFEYLRERARKCHLDGDGLQVNSLCSIALAQSESLADAGTFQLTLAEIRWCYIFPMYWLVDEYMLRAVERGLATILKSEKAEKWIHGLLEVLHHLVYQPLDDVSKLTPILDTIELSQLGESNKCEDLVLITYTVELLWFKSTRNGAWSTLIDKWLRSCPTWCRKPLEDLKGRLGLQTSLTNPNRQYPPVPHDIITHLPATFPLAELWVRILYSDGKAIDELIEKLNATTEPDSHIARLLFDAHLFNRFFGNFGGPQEVGLARRRLFVSTSPLLTFHELREAKLSEKFGELVRRSEVGGASGRFHVFTLAMLWELSALRLWDFFGWCAAVKAQSEAYLEAAKWKDIDAGFAAWGIELAIQSLSYGSKEKDTLIRNAICRLEFAPVAMLSEIGERLQAPYPRQKPRACEALADLSDLVPEAYWLSLSEWTIGYLDECRRGKHLGSSINPLKGWESVLECVDCSSKIWAVFFPETLPLVRNTLAWSTEDNCFHTWLTRGPIELALQLGTEMLFVQSADANSRAKRSHILVRAEDARAELKGKFRPQLLKLASEPIEQLELGGREIPATRAAAKTQYKATLERFISASVSTQGLNPIAFAFVSNGPIMMLDWNLEDFPLVKSIVATIDDPKELSHSKVCLLFCLQSLIRDDQWSLQNLFSRV
jgi:hypothetical protein